MGLGFVVYDSLSTRALAAGATVQRLGILSVHTCPLDQPGAGDAGGMNVFIRAVSRRLAEMGIAVDIFTRRAGRDQAVIHMDPGVRCIHLEAGPARPVEKGELPRHLSEFLSSLLRFEVEETARTGVEGPLYDVLHSHYWLSGWVARRAAGRWGIPFAHSSHTLGRVKNLALADGDSPEPAVRIAGEERVVQAADRILVPTPDEAAELVNLYGAAPERVRVVSPGVEARLFTPGDRDDARLSLGLERRPTVLFVGRLQPLKAPDVAVRAMARLRTIAPSLDPVLVVVGGPSGRSGIRPDDVRELAETLGVGGRVRVADPVPHERLADWYRAADAVVVPSRHESFGLVALEAAACGVPVVASDTGGLRTIVRDGVTGFLVPPGSDEAFARALARLLLDPSLARATGVSAARFARRFDWRQAASGLLGVYEEIAARAEPETETA